MSDQTATRGTTRLRQSRFVRVGLFSFLVILFAEGFLQLGSLIAHKRPAAWRSSATTKILTVGDSHTYGAGLPDDESYPAHLQQLLDEDAPGEFSVINLGVPGMSTTQVRNRLPRYVTDYQPDIVIVWCGVNNVWNYAEVLEGGWGPRLAALAYHSRLYRFVRVSLHNREFGRSAEGTRSEGRHQPWELNVTLGERRTFEIREGDKIKTWTLQPRLAVYELRRGDEVETIQNVHAPSRADDATVARTHTDLMAMMEWLSRAGILGVLVLYPQNITGFALANNAILRAAAESDVPLVDASISKRRIPLDQREWLPGFHPNGALYREIAKDIATVVVALSQRGND